MTRRQMLGIMAGGIASAVIYGSDAALAQSTGDGMQINLTVDASKALGPLRPIWRFFGCDEPNYLTMPHGEKLLGEVGRLRPGEVFFRTHNLLTTGDGKPSLKWGSTNAYTEDASGRPVYDWTIVDGILEAGLSRGIRPYVEIGFMPEALSVHPLPYRHQWGLGTGNDELFTGWAYPPKDYGKWAELVYQWVRHCVEKHGKDEVLRWYWEVWNEPNIGYWKGTRDEFFALHDHAIDAVRRALPGAKVGGPDVAGGPGGDFLHAFLEHCARGTNAATGKVGTPLDFIAFHAKGVPKFEGGHVRMGIANELRDIDGAFAVIASFPEFRNLPIVIGEADPDGCAACRGPQLGYRNGTLYASYTAAVFPRMLELADRHGVSLEGALTWAFTFEDEPIFAGFRQLASEGIDLPVLNVFRLFAKMAGERLAVEHPAVSDVEVIRDAGVLSAPDVSAIAALNDDGLSALVWHYHDDDVPGPDAQVALSIKGLRWADGPMKVTRYRIDHTHGNAYTAWQEMGSPEHPDADQYRRLAEASRMHAEEGAAIVKDGVVEIALGVPRQSVSLVVIQR